MGDGNTVGKKSCAVPPEPDRLRWLLKEFGTIWKDGPEGPEPDVKAIAAAVRLATGDDSLKGGILKAALDGGRGLTLIHARQLCDTLGADLRALAYGHRPELPPRPPMTLQQVLNMPI